MASPEPENPTFAFHDNEDANIPLARAMRAAGSLSIVSVELGRFTLDPGVEWEDTIARRIDELCELAGIDSEEFARTTAVMTDIFPPMAERPERGQIGRVWSDQTVGEMIACAIADVNDQNYDESFDSELGGVGHSFYISLSGRPNILLIDSHTDTDDEARRTAAFYAMYGEIDVLVDDSILNNLN